MIEEIAKENIQIDHYKRIVREYLTKEEIKSLHEKSDWMGLWEVLSVWLWIAAAMALVYFYSNIFTIVLAILIIGGKQLGCAIIMHDSSHYSLFRTKKLNDLFGNMFGAFPIFQNVRQYRPYHLQHHIATGTPDDPDILLTKGYPTTTNSMIRKFMRDLSGITGIKGFFGVILMHLGYLKYNLGNKITKIHPKNIAAVAHEAFHNLSGGILFHLLFFGIIWLSGKPWIYALWWIAFFTTYNLFLRIRSIAEHSVVPDSRNPYTASRTTHANFIEKIFFAPLHVNYHNEHHLMIAAPCYNYPKMHKLLRERGYYEKGIYEPNYWRIVKMAIIEKIN